MQCNPEELQHRNCVILAGQGCERVYLKKTPHSLQVPDVRIEQMRKRSESTKQRKINSREKPAVMTSQKLNSNAGIMRLSQGSKIRSHKNPTLKTTHNPKQPTLGIMSKSCHDKEKD